MPFDIVKSKLVELGSQLKVELQKEILLQKHKASGTLIDSLEMRLTEQPNKLILDELHEFYGDYVDRGRRAKERKVPIDALEKWVRLKGFAPGQERNVAFAIQKKIFEEGIPTNESQTLAPRRLNWLTGTIERNTDRIETALEAAITLQLNVIVDDILKKTNERIKAQR